MYLKDLYFIGIVINILMGAFAIKRKWWLVYINTFLIIFNLCII